MEGVVYFGLHTLDVNSWRNQSLIDAALNAAMELIIKINDSGYASVKVPEDWSMVPHSSRTFWDKLNEVFKGQNDLLTFVTTKLFNEVFNKCLVKNVSYETAEQSIKSENPNLEKMEYYAALKLDKNWPQVSPDLHVSNDKDMYNVALKFLTEAPFNEASYSGRSSKIFSNLIFGSGFAGALNGHGTTSELSKYSKAPTTGICGFSSGVTKSLMTLNLIDLNGKTTTDILAEVAAKSGFGCTVEGGKNQHLKFQCNDGDEVKTINCEFHIKINSNNENDGVYYQDRIYFGFFGQGADQKIFVAHSGKHL